MLKIKVIACDVLNREISFLRSQSECYVDVTFLHQGLHVTPDKLKISIQEQIDIANKGFPYNYFELSPNYDYIVLGYGLCSNGITGISSEKIPLIIPKGHDCITLLLGSKEKYIKYFEKNPGTYWYSRGWIECSIQPGEERYKGTYSEYAEKYGEDNAEYLMEMEQGWFKNYNNAVFINWEKLRNSDYYINYTKKCAEFLGWSNFIIEGSQSILEKILNGIIDENDVLLVPPGKKVIQSNDCNIISYE